MWLMVTQKQQSWLSTAHLFQHALGSPVSDTGRPTQSAQSQRPNNRAREDPTGDAASYDDECHDDLLKKRGGITAPCGSVTAPAGLRNLPGQTNAPACGVSLPVYSANPFWGRGCQPARASASVPALLPTNSSTIRLVRLLEPFTQDHGARCLKPCPFRQGEVLRSRAQAYAAIPRSQGRARCAPLFTLLAATHGAVGVLGAVCFESPARTRCARGTTHNETM